MGPSPAGAGGGDMAGSTCSGSSLRSTGTWTIISPTALHADDLAPEGWKPIRVEEETRQLDLLPLF